MTVAPDVLHQSRCPVLYGLYTTALEGRDLTAAGDFMLVVATFFNVFPVIVVECNIKNISIQGKSAHACAHAHENKHNNDRQQQQEEIPLTNTIEYQEADWVGQLVQLSARPCECWRASSIAGIRISK